MSKLAGDKRSLGGAGARSLAAAVGARTWLSSAMPPVPSSELQLEPLFGSSRCSQRERVTDGLLHIGGA